MDRLRLSFAAGIAALGLAFLLFGTEALAIVCSVAGMTAGIVYAGMAGWLNWVRGKLFGILCSGGCLGGAALVLFPVIWAEREHAHNPSCLSNLKQIALGIMQ